MLYGELDQPMSQQAGMATSTGHPHRWRYCPSSGLSRGLRALLSGSRSMNAPAVSRKAAVLAATGAMSSVRVTTGPSPKLMNVEAHSGEKMSAHTHLRFTMPAVAEEGSCEVVCL